MLRKLGGVRVRTATLAAIASLLVSVTIGVIATSMFAGNLRDELDRSLTASLNATLEGFYVREDEFFGEDAIPVLAIDQEKDFSLVVPIGADPDDGEETWIGAIEYNDLQTVVERLRSTESSISGDSDGFEVSLDAEPITIEAGQTWRVASGEFFDSDDTLYRVALGRDLATVDAQVGELRRWLLVAGLAATGLVAAMVWFGTGRALRPVERLRREADEITGNALSRRLPEPGTGDEIDRLARTMNELLARVERSQATQLRFVSDASHELRNPVAAVMAQLEVGLRTADAEAWPEIASTALVAAQRMQRLIDELLVLARADEGLISTKRSLVDLDDVVLAEIGAVRPSSTATIDASGVSAAVVVGDPARHARTQINVQLVESGGWVHLIVDDDGAGIPENDRERVFERFVRLDEARTRDDGGSGLGLSISRLLATGHGGYLVAEASPLGGARLRLVLPAAPGSG